MPGGAQSLIGSFGARLGLDSTDYARGILNANTVNAVFGANFAAFVSNPLLGAIKLFKDVGRAAISAADDVLNHAQQMTVLARTINASTDFVQALKAQYEGLGQNFESARPTLLKVVEALDQANRSGGPAADALERIGVSLADVTTSDQALSRIINGLAGVADTSERAALAMKILGNEGGPKLLSVIGAQSGAVEQMIEHYRRLGQVIDSDTLARTNALKDRMGDLEQAMEGVKRTSLAAFLEGFGQTLSGSAEDTERMAAVLNQRFTPAMRDAGEAAGELLKNIEKLITLIEQLGDAPGIKQIRQGLAWLDDAPRSAETYTLDFVHGLNVEFQRKWFGDAQADARMNAYLNRPMGVGR